MGWPLLKGASEPGSETLGGKSPSLVLPQLPLLWSNASDHFPLGVSLQECPLRQQLQTLSGSVVHEQDTRPLCTVAGVPGEVSGSNCANVPDPSGL